MKKCSGCEEAKALNEFHKLPSGKHGVNGRCKACRKAYSQEFYNKNKKRILPNQRLYIRTERGRAFKLANGLRMIKKYPEKYKARYMTRNAIRHGKLIRGICEVCQTKTVEAHHDDYSKPLDVRWFCMIHHKEKHEK